MLLILMIIITILPIHLGTWSSFIQWLLSSSTQTPWWHSHHSFHERWFNHPTTECTMCKKAHLALNAVRWIILSYFLLFLHLPSSICQDDHKLWLDPPSPLCPLDSPCPLSSLKLNSGRLSQIQSKWVRLSSTMSNCLMWCDVMWCIYFILS